MAELKAQPVYINEVLASNATGLEDEDGDTEDWVELYNAGSESVALGGYGLSDDPDVPFRWVLPDITMEPGEFLLIWASGKDRSDPAKELHANFSIASAGEEVLLTDPDGVRVDEIVPTVIPTDISFGRKPDGSTNWVFFTDPTPGAANTTDGFLQVLAPPELSRPAGFYEETFDLTAVHPYGEVVLRYTLDGSEPDEDSPMFPSSLLVGSRAGAPNVFSAINTTLVDGNTNDDYWEAPTAAVDKATVVRIRAFAENSIPSRTITSTFFADAALEGKYTLPVLSLVTDPYHLFDHDAGIYVAGSATTANQYRSANYWQRGAAWERPVHLELMDEEGRRVFAQDAGVRIHGGMTRRRNIKSLRLYARNEYGDSHFHFALFPDQPHDAYKRFMLRNSGQDVVYTYFRCAFAQRLVGHMRFDTQAYRPVLVFINGEYWGIHNMRERYDRHYLARTYGVDADNLDILTATHHDLSTSPLIVKEGDAVHYAEMINYIETHGVEEPEHYEHIRTMVDTDNYVDYLVANIFVNNVDWPGNNIEYWRVRTDEYDEDAPYGHDGRWRWLMFDMDAAFGIYRPNQQFLPGHNTLAFATGAGRGNWATRPYATFLPREMLNNQTFRNAFINRMADQLNTAFRTNRVIAVIDEMAAMIEPEMAGHINRFYRPDSMGTWSAEVDYLRQFAMQRPAHQYDHLLSYFGKSCLADVTLDISGAAAGRIRINTIVVDGDTFGLLDPEVPYPWTGTYVRDVPITLEALPAEGFHFTGWEGITNTSSNVTLEPDADLSVTALFEVDSDRVATALEVDWPAYLSQTGPLPPIVVRAVNDEGLTDPSFTGAVTIARSDEGTLEGSLTVYAVGGMAAFDDLIMEDMAETALMVSAFGFDTIYSDSFRFLRLTEVLLPRYMQAEQDETGNNFNRVPYAFRLRVEGLIPYATYRYGNRVVVPEDPPEQDGAGNMIIVRTGGHDFVRNTSRPRFRPEDIYQRHGDFVADAEGAYEGWFITEPSGNHRFVPGHTVNIRLILNDGLGGEAYHHMLTTTGGVTLLEFGNSPSQATAVMGESTNAWGHMVALYDDTGGVTRPLSATPIERTGSEVDERYAYFYEAIVAARDGYWGTLIPSALTTGVRRMEVFAPWDGASLETVFYEDGMPGTVMAASGQDAHLVDYVHPYTAWAAENFTLEEFSDVETSGYLADPDDERLANLAKYALGLDREDEPGEALPGAEVVPNGDELLIHFTYRRLLSEERGVDYIVEYAYELDGPWAQLDADVFPDLAWHEPVPSGDGKTEEVRLSFSAGATANAGFIRLRMVLIESP